MWLIFVRFIILLYICNMKIQHTSRLMNALNKNNKLKNLVKNIQVLNKDNSININDAIYNLKLPIKYHLFITSEFSNLMNLDLK